MAQDYPAHVYHDDGSHQVVASAEAHKALGSGWGGKAGPKHYEAIRRASGGVSEVIVPVTRTRQESI